MKVILRQEIPTLGKVGDIVNVKDGYARNYLIPRDFAFIATPGAIKAIEIEKKRHMKKLEKEREKAEALAKELAELTISIPMKVGEEGKLYGSVTAQLIAQELQIRNYDIDKKNIYLEESIKTLGIFDVNIKLHPEVTATIKIWVISEE